MSDIAGFSARLKSLRQKAGLTQADVARSLKCAESTVRMWELEKNEPDLETIESLANLYRTTFSYLVGDDPEKKPDESSAKVALFGGDGDVTDEMWDDVMNFVEFIKAKRQKEKRDGES